MATAADERRNDDHRRFPDRGARRGHERDEDRPRHPHRDSDARRSSPANLGTVIRDVDRLAYSITRAGARAYFGTVNALGDLVVNLADSYYSYPSYDDRERDRDRDRDNNTDAEPRGRRGRDHRRGRARSDRDRTSSLSSDLYGDLHQAIRDTADVLADSADEFQRVYSDEEERDDEDENERVASGDERSARPDRKPRDPPASTEPAKDPIP
jgi:hypothetical protein